MADRRRFPRLIGPFKGPWRGLSRGNTCQVRDISLDGCFVYEIDEWGEAAPPSYHQKLTK